MQRLYKIPLVFLLIAACIGLFLRYLMIAPVEGAVYSYWLHAHSHVMFLGWIFNVLIIAFATELTHIKGFKSLFWFLQCSVIGMLISFPIQGYGLYSITFSTLHTIGAFVFIVKFWRSSQNNNSLALILAKSSLLFFVLSSIGPFFLGYLKASGLDQSNLYRFAIYFYLHFQYNGFFLFGIISLFFKQCEDNVPARDLGQVKRGTYILISSCVPAYFLSVLWAEPGMIFNIIGLLSAIGQVCALYILHKPVVALFKEVAFKPLEKFLITGSVIALVAKSVLQLISAYPPAALFADEFRSIVIAYLHLVLLGCISFFLIAWLMRKQIISCNIHWTIGIILTGFLGSQMLLVIAPWNGPVFMLDTTLFHHLLFIFSTIMVAGIVMLFKNAVAARP